MQAEVLDASSGGLEDEQEPLGRGWKVQDGGLRASKYGPMKECILFLKRFPLHTDPQVGWVLSFVPSWYRSFGLSAFKQI